MAKVGRPKSSKVKLTKLGIMVDCGDEFCGNCIMVSEFFDEDTRMMSAGCKIFGDLLYVGGDRKARRCSGCHMAERCGAGEDIRL